MEADGGFLSISVTSEGGGGGFFLCSLLLSVGLAGAEVSHMFLSVSPLVCNVLKISPMPIARGVTVLI